MDKDFKRPKPTNDKKINHEEHAKRLSEAKREAEQRHISTYYGGRNIGD